MYLTYAVAMIYSILLPPACPSFRSDCCNSQEEEWQRRSLHKSRTMPISNRRIEKLARKVSFCCKDITVIITRQEAGQGQRAGSHERNWAASRKSDGQTRLIGG
ncbi:hypothetical protein BDR07DRAFT_171338 [Suillus spraguei]|nr:hypothetical protein BDR07DRAFT_171338 [Suillus spraguei]